MIRAAIENDLTVTR